MIVVAFFCAVSMSLVIALGGDQAGHGQDGAEASLHADHGHAGAEAGGSAGTQPDEAMDVESGESGRAAVGLSAGLRELLRQEMISLDRAMGTLGSDIAQGRWASASKTAGQMRDSFILKQALTQEQAHELHAKLPHGFIEQDIRFHKQADKLAGAAHRRDAELSVFYYGQMMNSCVRCHTTHAPGRFPGFGVDEAAGRGHE